MPLTVRVQDMDLARPAALDNRRLEIVTDGLTLFISAQLAADTTIVSVLKRECSARARCANHEAHLWRQPVGKEATFSELTGHNGRIQLVARLVGVGLERVWNSSPVWPKAKQEVPAHLRTTACQLGVLDGLLCWRAVSPKLWLFPCSNAQEAWVPKGSLRPLLK